VLGFLGLTTLPLLYALNLSFTDANGIFPTYRYIGLENYREILSDPAVIESLERTGLFALIVVPASVAGSLMLALLVNRRVHGIGIYRALFYLPSAVPAVASGLVWKMLFDQNSGVVNGLLHLFGRNPASWLTDPRDFFVLLLMMMWGVGGGMLVSLSGLQDVPAELYDAAKVDGANSWQSLRNVTLPLMSPILLFQFITCMISVLQVFVQPMMLSPIASADSAPSASAVSPDNTLYMVHVYAEIMTYGRFGYGCALLWLLFAIVLVITVLVLTVGKRVVFYNVDPDYEH
jgi:multiple sugar transport system permease protein